MGKSRAKKKAKVDDRIAPTPEQQKRADFHSAGMAYKRIPVIDTMLTRGQLSDKEHLALSYYRDQASLADRSPLKSCIDFTVTGGSGHPSAALTSAILETARLERDMLSCWRIARAVAVDDISLTEWCIRQYGGRERYGPKGNFIAIVPVREKNVVGEALRELKSAAGRIVK